MMIWRHRTVLACLCCLLAFAGVASADGDLWTTDFQEARAKAKQEGKSILMEFTGSDWCPPCKALTKNVFDTDEFKAEAPKHFVLLMLDFPRDKSKQTEEEIEQNQKLNAKYNVSGYPTILLTDDQGLPFAKMVGYGGTPKEEYIAELTKSAGVRKQRDEILARAENAKGIAKAKLLDQALSLLDPELAASTYSDTIDEIVALDAKDEAGLKTKYQRQLNAAKAKAVIADIQRSSDLDGSLEKLDNLISELDLEGETLQEVMYYKGYTLFRQGDKDKSKATLEAALKLAPESKTGKQIERILASQFK